MSAKKTERHTRTKYHDPSQKFLDWVDGLGLERTWFGRYFHVFDERYQLRLAMGLFGYCLLLSFLLFYDFEFPYNLEVGRLARLDVKSPMSLNIVDEVATEKKRQEAERLILPIFDYQPDIYDRVFNNVYKAFSTMRALVRSKNWSRAPGRRQEEIKDFLAQRSAFEKELGVTVHPRDFEYLVTEEFHPRIENWIIGVLLEWSGRLVIDAAQGILEDDATQIVYRHIEAGQKHQEIAVKRADLWDLRQLTNVELSFADREKLSPRAVKALNEIVTALLVPNLTLNRSETTERRKKARDGVLPVQIAIQKNQTIVAAGSMVQPIHVTIMNEITHLKSNRRREMLALITAFLFFTATAVSYAYIRRFAGVRARISTKDMGALAAIAVLVILLNKLVLFVSEAAFFSRFQDHIPGTALLYLAPTAAGAMLAGLIITSGEVVWLFTALLAMALAVMMNMNLAVFIVALLGGMAASHGVWGCKKRNDIYWAGLNTGLVNMTVILVLSLAESLGAGMSWSGVLANVIAGFLSGVLSSVVAMTVVPILESLFNYTTDVKLLELSNLNHPLMKEMMVRAPGTYHHSITVGQMVEAAAEVIGANSLLARVMAYYHDIGKMGHAQYFVENQRPGHNPHDHVSPHMSRTILIAHVKDGAEMGLKAKLGQPIVDGILQHHGTSLISYFYNKAREDQAEGNLQISENEFRYPGPKPQFREAALVMLADSIEAAARSLDEPTPVRLQNIVKNVIQNKFLDGQLDECNLTLRDLSSIEASYKKVLLGLYHQRVDYPHLNYGAAPARSILRRSKRVDSA